MDGFTVGNFRCFGDTQSARIAPITLLVGDNSTGKTSILALIRALWDVFYADRVPDFGEPPFYLGGFNEIVHNNGNESERPQSFTAGFTFSFNNSDEYDEQTTLFEAGTNPATDSNECTVKREEQVTLFKASVKFGSQAMAPIPVRRSISCNGCSVIQSFDDRGVETFTVNTPRGKWRIRETNESNHSYLDRVNDIIPPIDYASLKLRTSAEGERNSVKLEPLDESPMIIERDVKRVQLLVYDTGNFYLARRGPDRRSWRPAASAPVRSRPRRTYDPTWNQSDPEGDHVPTYLSQMALKEPEVWQRLKSRLESFGKHSGLFDEIRVRQLGSAASEPFQIQVRKSNDSRKDSFRNLIEVGYGVSQVLPTVTELLRDDNPPMMLLQQPEVHLHPSAAAALGTLLCEIAADKERDRRIVVETHSDFIIDRVRMAARDGVSGIKPEDVAILYFERRGPGVRIHTIGVDELGNLLDVPAGYRKFFMEESRRFLRTS